VKVVYFGTSEFAVPPLEAVAPSVVLVVTQPDRPSGRGMRPSPSPVRVAAERLGLAVLAPERAREPGFVAHVASLGADLLLVVAYGQILRRPLLEAARQGAFNLHGSILPAYRGAAPIQRCILAGEGRTGVTLMRMDEGLDTGDMVAVAETPVGPDETAGELASRLADVGAALAAEWLPRLVAGDFPSTPQDHARATCAPKLEKEEGRLDPMRPARGEYDRFRAFTPNPGASIAGPDGAVLRILEARLLPGCEAPPGVVAATRPELVVGFVEGGLRLVRVQAPGKRPVAGAEFANGARLAPGARFMP
jgi:methionyl-tRNA formyltransferase